MDSRVLRLSKQAMFEGWHSELLKAITLDIKKLENSEDFDESFTALDDLSGIIFQAREEAENNANYEQRLHLEEKYKKDDFPF
jgi:hypothetical protein